MARQSANRDRAAPCPCGSNLSYPQCCGRYLDQGLHAPSCEALMRSRYTAYVRGDGDYLLRTWHPDTRPKVLDLHAEPMPKWLGLKILAVESDPPSVEFVARYRIAGRARRLHERSRFVHADGRWWYLNGIVDDAV